MAQEFSASDVTIVTVSYNSADALAQMLPTLPADSPVVIVNNAGRDGDELDLMAKSRPHTRVVHNDRNLGFGEGCNKGVRAVETEFVFLLNPDTQIEENTLPALIAAAGRYEGMAAFNPRIAFQDGKPHFKRRSVLLPRSQWLPRGWPEAECDVPVLAGSAIFARTKVLRQVQFDPRIFLYHEDDDWSLRLVNGGGRLIFVPDAHITHLSGQSSGRRPEVAKFKGFHLGRSRIFAMERHKRPFARARSILHALGQLLSPTTWGSARKRAKAVGFYIGVRYPTKFYGDVSEIPPQVFHMPGWKLRRELKRLVHQSMAAPRALYDIWFRTKVHDAVQRKHIKRSMGQVPRGDRVAIYLVYARDGLLPSHKASIAHIRESGYAPFVISNLPLSEVDQAYLADNTWQFLSRPNLGYDFGGYREGFMSLVSEIDDLEYVAFLNDSSWFPVPGTQNWLEQAEALGVDYAGAATSFGIPRVPRDQYQTIQWDYDTSLSEFHYCSYAILVGKNMLRDKRYHRFWATYVLSEKKNKVVRRGEMGMSRFAIDTGFTHGATYDMRTLPDQLAKCSDDELQHYAHNMVFLGEWIMKEVLDNVLPSIDAHRSAADRQETIKLILATAARFGISYVLPEFLHKHHQFPFVKKSPLGIYQGDSDVMYAFSKTLEGPNGRIIQDEMEMIRRSKGFQTDAPPAVHAPKLNA